MILKIDYFYYLVGIILIIVALMSLTNKNHSKSISSSFFWGIYGLLFLLGNILPAYFIGILVLSITILAGLGKVKPHLKTSEQSKPDKLPGNRIFIPALAIPLITLVCTLFLSNFKLFGLSLFDTANVTLIGIGLGTIIALFLACIITNDTPVNALNETKRLIDSVSWPIILPQLLAILGLVFTAAGVSDSVSYLVTNYINMNHLFTAVVIYVVGSAIFSVIMGNGFVAFPIMTGGVGIPILIRTFHANPATVASIGMLSAYCGSLMTPMAANFNIVPAALLELPDRNLIIKVQAPTGFLVLIANTILLYLFIRY